MATLQARGLSFSFCDNVSLLRDVNLHLTPGWYGVVGANGAGKSTLLGLLSGVLTPDSGDLLWQPDTPRVVVCPQDIWRLESERILSHSALFDVER